MRRCSTGSAAQPLSRLVLPHPAGATTTVSRVCGRRQQPLQPFARHARRARTGGISCLTREQWPRGPIRHHGTSTRTERAKRPQSAGAGHTVQRLAATDTRGGLPPGWCARHPARRDAQCSPLPSDRKKTMASTVTPAADRHRTRPHPLAAERAARAGHRRRDRRGRGHGPAELPGLRHRGARPGQWSGPRPVAALAGHPGTARRGRGRRVGGEPAQHPAVGVRAGDGRHRRLHRPDAHARARSTPTAASSFIGLGCALENLVLACGPKGLQPDGHPAAGRA